MGAEIDGAADYAVLVINTYKRLFRERGIDINGLRVLEIGPGRDFAPQLAMVEMGADVTVADRWLSAWDSAYHPALYEAALSRLGSCDPIESVIHAGKYDGLIRTVEEQVEHMPSFNDREFDLIISTAVLEHVCDIDAALRELKRVSMPGAIHSHQVDFRYHRDFSKPLEHVLLSRWQFRKQAVPVNYEFGCHRRPKELTAKIQEAGFREIEPINSDMATDEYLDDFLPRLRKSWFSPYRKWSRDDLKTLGVRYWMRA